jgi:hypothetical protein
MEAAEDFIQAYPALSVLNRESCKSHVTVVPDKMPHIWVITQLVTRAPHAEALKLRVTKQRGKERKISESAV